MRGVRTGTARLTVTSVRTLLFLWEGPDMSLSHNSLGPSARPGHTHVVDGQRKRGGLCYRKHARQGFLKRNSSTIVNEISIAQRLPVQRIY